MTLRRPRMAVPRGPAATGRRRLGLHSNDHCAVTLGLMLMYRLFFPAGLCQTSSNRKNCSKDKETWVVTVWSELQASLAYFAFRIMV